MYFQPKFTPKGEAPTCFKAMQDKICRISGHNRDFKSQLCVVRVGAIRLRGEDFFDMMLI